MVGVLDSVIRCLLLVVCIGLLLSMSPLHRSTLKNSRFHPLYLGLWESKVKRKLCFSRMTDDGDGKMDVHLFVFVFYDSGKTKCTSYPDASVAINGSIIRKIFTSTT